MQLKYCLSFLLIATWSLKAGAQAPPENKPTDADGPSGSSYGLAPVPEIVTNGGANSVTFYAPWVPVNNEATLAPGASPYDVKQSVTYTDGFNTPFQSTGRYAAKVGGQVKHLVQLYDNRVQRYEYGFLPFSSDESGLVANAYQQQKDYYASRYPQEGAYSCFSKTENSSNANRRSSTVYAPGRSQFGNNRGTLSKVIANAANEVRIWEIGSAGLPVATGYYGANELTGTETILPDAQGLSGSTADNPQTRTYSDRDGNLVLKMVADGNAGGTPTYLYTYYVYDAKGNLRFTISPKAYEYFTQYNTLTAAIANQLCFQYRYDNKGRLTESRKPGEEGFTEIVYDRKDRPVMRRTPNEKNEGKWEATFLDPYGRVKATSLYGSSESRVALQAQLDGWSGGGTGNLMYYLATAAGAAAVPDENAIAGNTMMSYAWYDNYGLADPGNAMGSSYAANGLQPGELQNGGGAEAPAMSMRLQGMSTGGKVRILTNGGGIGQGQVGLWRRSVNYYDDKGRLIYQVSADVDENGNPVHEHYTSMQYDFAGRLRISKHMVVNANSQDAVNTHTELTKYQYENGTGRLLKTWHKVDDGAWALLNILSYDDMGRLKRKSLGGGGEVQDYTYNLRGQLQGINEAYAQTAYTGGMSKTFGEALRYDYGFEKNRYDGKLAGVMWRGSSPGMKFAYGYDYHQNQALQSAAFTYMALPNTNTWENTALDYTVWDLNYDKNGNIRSMNQKGLDPGNGVTDLDILNYTYKDGGWSNQLDNVSDGGQEVPGAGDFRQNNVTGGNACTYDANGNLAIDKYKGVHTATYTFFDKPLLVSVNNGEVEYAYDAAGSKVAELIRDSEAGTEKLTEYIGNFVYVDKKLSYILTAEGRTVFDEQAAMPVREEFFVKDHLGNVRSTINVSTYDVKTYLGTFEIASANLENLIFDNLDEVRDYKPGGGADNTMAALLDGADPKRRIGASLLVHVMAGDRVSMNVNNYYQSYNPYDDAPVDERDMLAALTGALTGGAGGLSGGETHDTRMVNQLFSPDRFTAVNNIVNGQYTDASKPRAYLNYVLFDEKMEVVKEMTGAFQASGEGNWTEIGTTGALEVPANGYLAVYLSNASLRNSTQDGQQVFFDQLRFTVSKGNLLEESHYYPFGLPMYGMGSSEPSMKEQRRRYQGNEYITELGLHWMDFNNRQYDPQLGRFLGVDPLADMGGQEMYSPYAAMGNMPEMLVDPNGLMPGFDKAEAIGGGPVQVGDMGRIGQLSVDGMGGGGLNMMTMGGINLDPNNLFNPTAAFNVMVVRIEREKAAKAANDTRVSAINSALAAAKINVNIGVNGKWVDGRVRPWKEAVQGGNLDGVPYANDGKGKELTPSKITQYNIGLSETSLLHLYIWDNASGVDKRQNYGHVAIEINGLVYGLYPADGSSMWNGPAELRVYDMTKFRERYNGQLITSYEVVISEKDNTALTASLNYSAKNPGIYSICGINCTSFAVQKLQGIGINIYTGCGNVIDGLKTTPFILNQYLKESINRSTFINQKHYKIE